MVAVTAIRLVGLTFSDVDLFFDESQYWAWSRELAFGYFSKPPLLAWVIAVAEFVCGSGEACIRAPAPILYLGTSLVSYLIAEALYDETHRVLGRDPAGAERRRRVFEPHHLDRRAAVVLLGGRALCPM